MSETKASLHQRIMEWIWDKGGPCHTCTVSLSESMDRRLGLVEWWHMRFHMYFCHWCRHFKAQSEMIRNETRSLARALKDDDANRNLSLSAASRDRMKALLNNQ